MNPIILHIGATKTGSSSLQSYLAGHNGALAAAGFCFPEAGRGAQFGKAHHNIFYETKVDGGHGTFDWSLGGWEDVLREIDNVPSRTGIISSEAFQYFEAEQVREIAKKLGTRQVTVVMYLRRHDRWLQSAWNQRARFARVNLNFDDFFRGIGKTMGDYAHMLGPWLETFGDEHVDVRVYDSVAVNPGIVTDFALAHLPGVDPAGLHTENKRKNTKAGLKHVLGASLVARSCRKQLGEGFALPSRSAAEISSFFRGRLDRYDYSVITYDEAVAISHFFKASDRQLAKSSSSFCASKRFDDPQPEEFENFVDLSEPDAIANQLFDEQETQFVNRIAKEIVKASGHTSAGRSMSNARTGRSAKPIVIHIGTTKTGTSSLQKYLKKQAASLGRQGVTYPTSGRSGSDRIAHHNLCYERHPFRVEWGRFKPEDGTWSQALAEIDEASSTVGIISSEAFMNLSLSAIPALGQMLTGREVKIVAYIRRQDRWMQSAWNQRARFGRTSLDFWEFFERIKLRGYYHRKLARWAKVFGPDRLIIRNFDALPAGGIVQDFFDIVIPDVQLNEPDVNEEHRNSKAGIKQLVATSMVLDICRERVGQDFKLAASSALRISEYFRACPNETTAFSIISYEDACQIHRHFAESNQFLEKLSPSFGEEGGFQSPKPEEFRNYVNIMELGEEVLTQEERRFAVRMGREVSRVANQ